MRTVPPEEAKISRDKLESWTKEDSISIEKGKLGEWISQKDVTKEEQKDDDAEYELITKSETPNDIQTNWRTPTSFPLSTKQSGEKSLQ